MAVVVVGGFALFGNVLIILLAAKYTVRKSIHYMIINMALSDILVVLMFSSIQIYYTVTYAYKGIPDELTADILCKMRPFWDFTAKLVTLVNLLIISVERFRATRLTVQRARPHSRKTSTALVLCSWLLPMSLSAYNLYFWKTLYKRSIQSYWCTYDPTIHVFAWSVVFIVFVVISLLTIVILSTLTLRSLSTSDNMLANLSNIQRRRRTTQMAGAVKMVLCSLLVYSCCYIPGFSMDLFWTIFDYNKRKGIAMETSCTDWKTLYFMKDFLLLVNSCFSPCVYIVFLKDFREAARLLLLARPTQEPKPTADTMELDATNLHTTRSQHERLHCRFEGPARSSKVVAVAESRPTDIIELGVTNIAIHNNS